MRTFKAEKCKVWFETAVGDDGSDEETLGMQGVASARAGHETGFTVSTAEHYAHSELEPCLLLNFFDVFS